MEQLLRHRLFFVFCGILLFLVGFAFGTLISKETVVVKQGTPENPAAISSANLMLDYGNGIIRTWSTVSIKEGTSVMDLINKVAEVGEIKVEMENIDGKFRVKAVDGIQNGDGKRWQYWINNTFEPRIASKYYIKPGDMIVLVYANEQG